MKFYTRNNGMGRRPNRGLTLLVASELVRLRIGHQGTSGSKLLPKHEAKERYQCAGFWDKRRRRRRVRSCEMCPTSLELSGAETDIRSTQSVPIGFPPMCVLVVSNAWQ